MNTPKLPPLPERDTSKPAEQQGVFRKFDVRRTDGSSEPGGKHHGCEYFVLDVDHDQAARAALKAYADAVEATHPLLAADMRKRYAIAAIEAHGVPDGLHLIVSGAIFDFAGFLTSSDEVIPVGGSAESAPMVDRIQSWAKKRGLSLKDAATLSWQHWLASAPPAPQATRCELCQYQHGHQIGCANNLVDIALKAQAQQWPFPGWEVQQEHDVVSYVLRWGGNCRDCADEGGVCPGSGLPCGGARKAIEHVLKALRYGVQQGYIRDPLAAPQANGYGPKLMPQVSGFAEKAAFCHAKDAEQLTLKDAQASKCPTCNENGLVGGPSFYAPDEGGVPCPDCSQAAVVQQEPLGFISPKQVERIVDQDGEFGAYIPMRKTPAGNFTLAIYTHPAQKAKPQPLSDEQDRALCEAYCNTASDEYFNARPHLDSAENRRIFYAGHRKAWIEWQDAHGIKE